MENRTWQTLEHPADMLSIILYPDYRHKEVSMRQKNESKIYLPNNLIEAQADPPVFVKEEALSRRFSTNILDC